VVGVTALNTKGADIDYWGLGVAVWLGSGDVSAALFLSEAIGVHEATARNVATFEAEGMAVAGGSWAVGEISGRLGVLPRLSCILCWRSVWICACSCSRRFSLACLGEKTFSAEPGSVASAAVSGVMEGCGVFGRGEIVEAGFGRNVAADVGNGGGAWGGLSGKCAGVPTGIALAVETAGFTA